MESKDLEFCERAFAEFSERKEFVDVGNAVYALLKPYIPFNKKVKQEIWDIAYWRIKNELRKEDRIFDSKDLKYNDECVLKRAKELALHRFFSYLIEMNIDLQTFIKDTEETLND